PFRHLSGGGHRCCRTLRQAPHRKRPTQHPLHLLDRPPHFTLGKQRGVLHHAHRGLLCWLLHHNQLTKEPHLSAQGFSRIHGRTSAYTPGRSSVSHPRPWGLHAVEANGSTVKELASEIEPLAKAVEPIVKAVSRNKSCEDVREARLTGARPSVDSMGRWGGQPSRTTRRWPGAPSTQDAHGAPPPLPLSHGRDLGSRTPCREL